MATVRLVKRPPPPSVQAEVIRNTAKSAIREHLAQVKDAHDALVEPWEVPSDVPVFEIVDVSERGKVKMGVLMDADAAESATLSVWQLLDRGTDVRFMQVSSDWQSKTSPRQLQSGAGAGQTEGLNIHNPQPGIEAREFADAVAEELPADDAVKRAYDAGFARNFR